jgi:hypothetical protein
MRRVDPLDIVSLSAGGYLPFPRMTVMPVDSPFRSRVNAERAGFSNGKARLGVSTFIDVTFANFLDAEVDGTFRRDASG